MASMRNRFILWTGPKHCGKTTSAEKLIRIAQAEGFKVAGLLEPSSYDNGELIGFDVLDVRNQTRVSLARRISKSKAGPFDFLTAGLKFGNNVLNSEDTKSADLVIIDEFGPLELERRGWRKNIDSLLASSNAIILIIIRKELAGTVKQLYINVPCRELAANKESSVDEVISMLKTRLRHTKE
ncbi:MAG: nucleoside-triphosphatase [Phycisphaerales bacterium]|jgi:nucleoside-triphosphatase THEP1